VALNPVAYTEKVARSFLRYQLTTYPFADPELHAQMRALLSLEETRRSPLLHGPYVSLSRPFRAGTDVRQLVAEGVLQAGVESLVLYPRVYGHQERAIRAIHAGRTTLVSTGTGSGKTECFLYPIISRCIELRGEQAPPGIAAVLVYPMNALAEDQLLRLRELLAGTGISFGMYVGKTPEKRAGVAGKRLRDGSSRAAYLAELARAQTELRTTAVHPAEERCSREEMREPGGAPRILLTNVNQLELLLTREADVGLFDGAHLEFLVFDEAHTWSGAAGAETACLIRRLRAFCGSGAKETICVATSATIADPIHGPDAAREFAARFFGVDSSDVELVGEEYEADVWARERINPPLVPGDPAVHLAQVLTAVDDEEDRGAAVSRAVETMTGTPLPSDGWDAALHERLAANEVVYQLAGLLERPRGLWELVGELSKKVGRDVLVEEALAWLALGAVARKDGRPLLRPVVHAFVRGVGGAIVTFPAPGKRPRLWLSAEEEQADRGTSQAARLPVTTCTTCGQHYFVHHVADLSFTGKEPGGGHAVGDGSCWPALDPTLGGKRVVLLDRVVSTTEDDEAEDPPRTAEVFLCRACGALHPTVGEHCLACAAAGPLERLLALQQREDHPGYLTRCVSCGAPGRARGTGYREPARPVRAVTVSDVHVLAQDMVHHAERRRLLLFTDNRQDAAFQAGWMRDHSRRFRLRALMAQQIQRRAISLGDLASSLDEALEHDDDLSRSLAPEVWDEHRKEAEGVKHREKRKYFLRIQVFRELTTGVKQRIGLEPWGRLRVDYAGLDAADSFVAKRAPALGIEPDRLADGIAGLLDRIRRTMHLLDRDGRIFSRILEDGAPEIMRGYMPKFPGVPRGLKLRRERSDEPARVTQWLSERGDTYMRQAARTWRVDPDHLDEFVEELWRHLCDDLRLLAPVTLAGWRGKALPGCPDVRQIDADKLMIASHRGIWRCRRCRRAQVRPAPFDRCLAWRCEGTLDFVPDDQDNYDLALLDSGVKMIRPREHSAQVPHDQRERLERAFKGEGEAVNTLVCTPTLELGVDIGALDTVLMRNVPPLPSNYWQRVGRAGRRHRMAVNVTYARANSHDALYFASPLRLLEGRVEPPSFNLRNELMVCKHVHAAMLTRLQQLGRRGGNLPDLDREEVEQTIERTFPRQTKHYLFDDGGEIRTVPFDVEPFRLLVSKHEKVLLDHVRDAFRSRWPTTDAEVVREEVLEQYIREAPERLEDVLRALRKRLDWALDTMRRLDHERQRKGALEPDQDALHRRCDRLVKRFKAQQRRQRRETEGVDDVSTFSVLAAEGFLPGYGLETGSVVGTAQIPRQLTDGADLELRRPAALAVREYVPGNLIYANGHRFVARYYHLLAESPDPVLFQVDPAAEAVSEVGAGSGAVGLGVAALRAVPICDVDLPHQSHISDDEEHRFQLPVAVYGYELERHGGGRAFLWGERSVLLRRGVHFRLVNVGAARLVTGTASFGYPVCLVCGQSRSPFSSQKERDHFVEDHLERCRHRVEPTGFYSDSVADALSLPDCGNRTEAYSVLEALRTGATRVLEMDREDLEILVIGSPGTEACTGLLYDPMPGGSGLLQQLCACFAEVVTAAREIVEKCPSSCARGCIDCLFTFRNAFFHRHLDRHLAAECLARWGAGLARAHEIPPKLPAEPPRGSSAPVNLAESRLRAMILKAGFPEPRWQHQIQLGLPLGSTTPDCFFAGAAEDDPGACIFLDGLSQHIHGNTTTATRDRAIREELRSRHYWVFEIPASDLDDRGAMAGHFFRLGQVLLGRDRATAIRSRSDWFDRASQEAVSSHPPGSDDAGPVQQTVAADSASGKHD
jgi:ATP-dependent helicase YprA (DUF1998 family)